MAAKKTKKRIQPVVEVVEEVEDTKTETTPKVKKTEGTSLEPDFSSRVSESVGEGEEETTEEVVEEVVEESEPETEEEVVVEEVVEEEPQTEEVVEEVVVEEPAEKPKTEEVVEEVVVSEPAPAENAPTKQVVESSKKVEHKMSIKTILLITIISALVAAFVSGGVYVYLNGVNELKSTIDDVSTTDEESIDEEDTEDPEPTAEPTEAPTVSEDLSVYKIEVLNGSGEIGAAGEASDVLEDGGFVVENAGNADNYDFTDTIVQYKEGINMADVDALVKALEESYSVELSDDTLDEDSEYDFIVTVGTD